MKKLVPNFKLGTQIDLRKGKDAPQILEQKEEVKYQVFLPVKKNYVTCYKS